MAIELKDFLDHVRRRGASGGGIELGSHYAAGVGPCLTDDGCQADFFKLATPAQWGELIDKAANQLVYTDPEMAFTDGVYVAGPGTVRQFGEKRVSAPRPGACMAFDCVVTSTREDRDKDVLETAGAELDPAAPVLWQHIPVVPVGTVDRETGRSAKRLTAACSVIDSPQGNDAAQLAEFGALRISHGFIPKEYEPRERKKGDKETDPFPGWHVTKFKILEVSLVSVPSNEDAVITALSRAKLAHPLIKAWAAHVWSKLPASVVGGWGTANGTPTVTAPAAVVVPPPAPDKGCGCGKGKGKAKADPGPGDPCPDCGKKLNADGECPNPACEWEPEDKGKATTDEHKCPDCGVKLDDKDTCPKCGKKVGKAAAGKGKLPKRTLVRLDEAAQLAAVVKTADELKPHTRASATRTHGLLVEVLADARAATGGEGGQTPAGAVPSPQADAGELATRLLGRLYAGDELPAAVCRSLREAAGAAETRAQLKATDAAFTELLTALG